MDDKLKQQIVSELGLSSLSGPDQDNALERVGMLIFQSVLVRVVDELDETSSKEFERLLSAKPNDGGAVIAFLNEKLPNFDAIVREEVLRFKEEAAAVMKAV